MGMLKSVANLLWKNKFTTGFAVWSGVDTYKDSKEKGDSTAVALGKGVVEGVLGTFSFPLYMAYEVATNADSIVKGVDTLDKLKRQAARDNSTRAFGDAHFNDNEQLYTMRQRGMAIAQRSKYNTQQAMMGQEAKYMKR